MIQQVFILFHGSAFPIVLLLIFAQKPDTRLGLKQTFEDLFKSSVNEKSFEDDIPPVNYQMWIPEVQYSSHLSACRIPKSIFRRRNIVVFSDMETEQVHQYAFLSTGVTVETVLH